MILALDISTSIIGWSLWDNKKLTDNGFVLLTNSKGEPKDLMDRLDLAIKNLSGFSGVKIIAAEAAMQKFSGGQTTANTMNKLIAMNFGLVYSLSRLYGCECKLISVNEARGLCGIKIPRQKGKKDPKLAKKIVINHVANNYPSVKFELTKSGNYKKGYDDMADSIIIGEAIHHNI